MEFFLIPVNSISDIYPFSLFPQLSYGDAQDEGTKINHLILPSLLVRQNSKNHLKSFHLVPIFIERKILLHEADLHTDPINQFDCESELEIVCSKKVQETILDMVQLPEGEESEQSQDHQQLRNVKQTVETHCMNKLQDN